jgi:4-hydroxy-tetrahydrodipicolinate synthase
MSSMKIDQATAGVYAIAPTPFLPDESVDLSSMDRLMDYYEQVGVDGVTILGILGEAQKLEPSESLAVLERVLARTRLPVIVGVSAPGLASMRTLAHAAMEKGAAGVMIGPAPHLRTDDQIVSYYRQAARAIGEQVPFVLQDYPLALGVQISSEVIRRIVEENGNCVMLKHEDWPGLDKVSALRGFESSGKMRRISILCGNGGLFLDFELDRAVDGAMTGYAFPELLVDMVRRSRAGDRDGMHDLFDAHLPLLRYEHQQGVGLSVRKYVFRKRGIFTSDILRAPGAQLNPTTRAEVDYLIARVARRDPRIDQAASATM